MSRIQANGRMTAYHQTAELQRALHDAAMELREEMKQAKSAKLKLELARGLAQQVGAFETTRLAVRSYLKKKPANGHNGHANAEAPRNPARPAPPAPLDEPDSKESLIRPDPPHTPPPRGESEGAPHLSSLPPES